MVNRLLNLALSIFLLIILFTTNVQCQSPSMNGFNLQGSLIPEDEIRHGGPPRDGIPSIDNPKFVKAENATYPSENDRVLGVEINGIAKAYPIGIMNYHEIVNDFFGSTAVVVTYCPLCGSGIAYYSHIKNKNRTFGVSGLLYNSDVLLYDRESESLWSQLMNQAVTGPLKGTKLKIIPTSNTTWREWKERYPNTLVMTTQTGYQRDYSRTPYTGYDESERLYFPVSNTSNKYHPKELVTGIEVNGISKAYPFEELEKSDSPVTDKIGGEEVKVFFDRKNRTARILDSNDNELPYYTTFWFAWYTFHPDTEIYKAR